MYGTKQTAILPAAGLGMWSTTLAVIFGESHAYMRIVENHAYLCRRVGLIHRNSDCANGHDGQIKGSPLP